MIKQPFNLKDYNTFGFEVLAQAGAIVGSVAELNEAIVAAKLKQLPLMIIGDGSNVVLKNNLPLFAVVMRIPGIEKIDEDMNHVYIRVGAGIEWDELVHYSLHQGWYGLENLSIIPGTVGACPIQNVGAYGVEIKDFFHELTAVEIDSVAEKIFSKEACEFKYRDSIFKNEYRDQYVITSVTFRLNKRPKLNLNDRNLRHELRHLAEDEITALHLREAVIAIRTRRLPNPKYIGNAGSFFMNPIIDEALFHDIYAQYEDLVFTLLAHNQYKISAAWLVDKCGWKGYQENAVGVFEVNALVLINRGGGTADELLALSHKIQQSVFDTFGVNLKMEPRLYA
ncbi:MAG: UDP-N-acetylmuramate dehydrogenase [Gammaproteobacteria bacterium]|nr:UDP-N-acetylmuramate dehydrogenase [Gammaproteobacteria bacterium]